MVNVCFFQSFTSLVTFRCIFSTNKKTGFLQEWLNTHQLTTSGTFRWSHCHIGRRWSVIYQGDRRFSLMKGMTISRWWFIWSRICWVLVYISCKWMNDCVAATAVVFGTFRSYQTEPVHKVAPKTCCASWSLSCLQSKWLPSSIVTLGCTLARWLGWVGWVSMLLFFHVHCISFPKQVYMYVFFYSLDLLRKRCMPGTHDFAPTSFCSHGRCLWVEKVSGLCFNVSQLVSQLVCLRSRQWKIDNLGGERLRSTVTLWDSIDEVQQEQL